MTKMDITNLLNTSATRATDLLGKTCRICLCTGDLQSLTIRKEYIEFFHNFLQINLQADDCLPKNACILCLKQITDTLNFIGKCNESNEFLKNFIQNPVKLNDVDALLCLLDVEQTTEEGGAIKTPINNNEQIVIEATENDDDDGDDEFETVRIEIVSDSDEGEEEVPAPPPKRSRRRVPLKKRRKRIQPQQRKLTDVNQVVKQEKFFDFDMDNVSATNILLENGGGTASMVQWIEDEEETEQDEKQVNNITIDRCSSKTEVGTTRKEPHSKMLMLCRQKPYGCSDCNKRFNSTDELKMHYSIAHLRRSKRHSS